MDTLTIFSLEKPAGIIRYAGLKLFCLITFIFLLYTEYENSNPLPLLIQIILWIPAFSCRKKKIIILFWGPKQKKNLEDMLLNNTVIKVRKNFVFQEGHKEVAKIKASDGNTQLIWCTILNPLTKFPLSSVFFPTRIFSLFI